MKNERVMNSYLQQRVTASQEKVLEAALTLFSKHGFAETSIDEIQKVSGVAKTTIYRHWKTKSEIAISVLSSLNEIVIYPEHTGNLKVDLESDLLTLVKLLASPKWSRMVIMLIEASDKDNQLMELRKKFVSDKHQRFETILKKGISDGVLPRNLDYIYAAERLYAIPFYRRLIMHKKTGIEEVKQIVKGFLKEMES